MKVMFKNNVAYQKGTIDMMTFWAAHNKLMGYARKWVMPTITADNLLKGAITRNLASVWLNAAPTYKQDGKTYAAGYFSTYNQNDDWDIARSSFALFMKMMYAWYDSDPEHVDLATVTIADIVALDADVQTWASAVTGGFLPTIPGIAALTAGIQ